MCLVIDNPGFRELSVLGEGSYGRVSLHRKKKGELGNDDVVCVIKTPLTAKTNKAALREFEILSKLDSQYLVRTYGAFYNDNNFLCIVLKHAKGGDLQDLLRNADFHLGVEQAQELFRSIFSGIIYLYNKRVIHRDLKPGNVLVDITGKHGVITDFGTSVLFPSGDREAMEKSEDGTLHYEAPEIFNEEVYLSSDWWSLGCILYELVHGKAPFAPHDPDPEMMKENINSLTIVPPRKERTDCILNTELFYSLCERDPLKRLDNMQKLLSSPDELSKCLPCFEKVLVADLSLSSLSLQDKQG